MLRTRMVTRFGKSIYTALLRNYAQEAPKFSLRNADGERLTSSEFFKQVASVKVPESEQVTFPRAALDLFATEYDAMVRESHDSQLYEDKYKRALAETENVRRRLQKQIEDTKSYVMQGFCKDLLEVADILNLALDSLEKTEGGTQVSQEMKGMREGVAMTKDVLLKTFAKHGLELIHPQGEKFDPNLHDAIFEVPHDKSKSPPGHVDQVLKVGYRLHQRPIRPAKVSVVRDE